MPARNGISRRTFLKRTGVAAAGLALVDGILADPYRPRLFAMPGLRSVRVRGAVRLGGIGVGGVGVSDGRDVVRTGRDGSYELLTDASRPFVYLSVPAGAMVPVSPFGTAAHYLPLRPGPGGEMEAEWDLQPLPGGDDTHGFLLLADPQTLDADDMKQFREETVPDVRRTIRGMEDAPVFGVSCGDIMFDRLELFPDYKKGVRETGIPFFQVLGNHDVTPKSSTDEASSSTFTGHFGPAWYSFNRGAVHYVVLDDVFWFSGGYIGYLTQEQLDWLAADLALVEPGRVVVVFMHIPAYSTQHIRQSQSRPERNLVVVNREALYRLLEPFTAHIIVGHMHETEHLTDGGARHHTCGAVCGAWWSGPICGDGTPKGYGVYEVRGEELRWRYKATGLSADEQLRVYPAGSEPSAPEEIVANVWDWRPGWKVTLFERGESRGPMSRRRGFDPLSMSLHTGPSLPAKHPWVEPYRTDHLFYAPVSAGAKDLTVEATDTWGRTFRMPLG